MGWAKGVGGSGEEDRRAAVGGRVAVCNVAAAGVGGEGARLFWPVSAAGEHVDRVGGGEVAAMVG